MVVNYYPLLSGGATLFTEQLNTENYKPECNIRFGGKCVELDSVARDLNLQPTDNQLKPTTFILDGSSAEFAEMDLNSRRYWRSFLRAGTI